MYDPNQEPEGSEGSEEGDHGSADVWSLLKFILELGKLKSIKRQGWLNAGIEAPESVADHSYRCAMLALIFAKEVPLDELKVIKMALVHDICEIYSGDITPLDGIDEREKFEREKEGLQRAISTLPVILKNEIYDLWMEYEGGKSPEAIFVKQIDILERVIQAYEYEVEGIDSRKLRHFWEKIDGLIKNIGFMKVVDELKDKRGLDHWKI